MNFSGDALVSRPTLAAGRGILGLGGTVLLVNYLKIDLQDLSLLGVKPEEMQLRMGSAWVLAFLWFVLLANWIFDLSSLGRWNSSMQSKLAESTYGGGGKIKSRLLFIVESIEREVAKTSGNGEAKPDLAYAIQQLRDLNDSYIMYNFLAKAYVIGWVFLLPTLVGIWATLLLLCP